MVKPLSVRPLHVFTEMAPMDAADRNQTALLAENPTVLLCEARWVATLRRVDEVHGSQNSSSYSGDFNLPDSAVI